MPPEKENGADKAKEPSAEDQLKARVNELSAELKELKDDRLRMLAEMENVRAIARRDVETAKTYAIQSFAKQLLDVADTLGMAIDSVPTDALTKEGTDNLKTLHEGVSMTRKSLIKLFNNQGVQEVGVWCLESAVWM